MNSVSRAKAGAPRTRSRARRVVAVGGGKGGIGKSLLSANLSIELARRGNRVVAIDGDLGGANLHTCLGVPAPGVTLSDFITRKVSSLGEVAVPTGIAGLVMVSGALDVLDAANPKYAQKQKLLRNIRGLDVDYVVIDLGAGSGFNVLDFFLLADHGILVLVPEPTSIENAYRFVKAAFFRRLASLHAAFGVSALVQEVVGHRREDGIRTPHDVLAAVRERDPVAGEALEREIRRFRPRLVVNQSRGPEDAEVGEAVVTAWRKHFGLEMDYLGAIGYDDQVWRAVRRRRPVLLEFPEAEMSRSIARIADRLVEIDQPGRRETGREGA